MTKEETPHLENDTLLDTFIPTDYTDVGQGALLARAYPHRLCYCEGIGWLSYKEGIWVPSDIDAQGYSQKLTALQLQEATSNTRITYQPGTPASESRSYLDYVLTRRSSARVAATLKEAMPALSIDLSTSVSISADI